MQLKSEFGICIDLISAFTSPLVLANSCACACLDLVRSSSTVKVTDDDDVIWKFHAITLISASQQCHRIASIMYTLPTPSAYITTIY